MKQLIGNISFSLNKDYMQGDEHIADFQFDLLNKFDSEIQDVTLDVSLDSVFDAIEKIAIDTKGKVFITILKILNEAQSYYIESEDIGGETLLFWADLKFKETETEKEHFFPLIDIYERLDSNDECWNNLR